MYFAIGLIAGIVIGYLISIKIPKERTAIDLISENIRLENENWYLRKMMK